MEKVATLEHQFLVIEMESIEKWKEDQQKTDQSAESDSSIEMDVGTLKKQVESLKPVSETDVPLEDIQITTIKQSYDDVSGKQSDPFSFLNSSDDPIKITAKESDETVKDEFIESDLDIDHEPKEDIPKYKFPTF